jgi:ubiquinone/menaquinone biosynthesis C-methylase UbiE
MPDVWSMVAELDEATQERLADVLETRGAEPRQQAIRRAFLAEVPFSGGAPVLEIGCGTGVLTRVLAGWPQVGEVVGVDAAPSLLARARQLAADLENVRFEEADARALPFEAGAFGGVVFDSALSHIPAPERALAEAARVLRPGGCLAAFDGDYATTTVALGENDPLQACVDAMLASFLTDRFLMRRLPALVQATGLEVVGFHSHGYVETSQAGYMLTIVDRGVELLHAAGQAGEELAAALKAEARRRVAAGAFFGHIAYASLIARKAE